MDDYPYVNEVSLVGRLSDSPLIKTLPSGDLIMLWRLIVDRPAAELRTPRRVVDTINCVTFDSRLFGPAGEWRPDQLLEIHGALRRRFWPGGSRCEVVVDRARARRSQAADDRAENEADGRAEDSAADSAAGSAEDRAATSPHPRRAPNRPG